jgi:hypothetical protein
LSSLQLLLHGLGMGRFLCQSVGWGSQTLRRILDVMGLLVLHLGKDLRIDFPLSRGRIEWPFGLRILHTSCKVDQESNSTKCPTGIWDLIFCKVLKHNYSLQNRVN